MRSLSHLAKFLPQAFILYVLSNSVTQMLIESWILPKSDANLIPPSSPNHQETCNSQMLMDTKVTPYPYFEVLLKCPLSYSSKSQTTFSIKPLTPDQKDGCISDQLAVLSLFVPGSIPPSACHVD